MTASGRRNDTDGLARGRDILQRTPLAVGQPGGRGGPHDADEPHTGLWERCPTRDLADRATVGENRCTRHERHIALYMTKHGGRVPEVADSSHGFLTQEAPLRGIDRRIEA